MNVLAADLHELDTEKNHDQEFGKRENRSNSRFRESYFYQSNGIICV